MYFDKPKPIYQKIYETIKKTIIIIMTPPKPGSINQLEEPLLK